MIAARVEFTRGLLSSQTFLKLNTPRFACASPGDFFAHFAFTYFFYDNNCSSGKLVICFSVFLNYTVRVVTLLSSTYMPHEWWEGSFDRNYIKIYSRMIDESVTRRQVVFLKKILKLKKGSRILDLACGYGRHSIMLATSGFRVTGFDYSKSLLSAARSEARKQKVAVRFVQGDMRQLRLSERFDAVVNLFTSFGYFKKKSDDALVLKNVYTVLSPGGKFVIDLINPGKHLAVTKSSGRYNPKSKSWCLMRENILPGNIVLKTQSEINPATMVWKMTRSWNVASKKFSYTTSVRLYSFKEISRLLRRAGFIIVKTYGNFNGDPLSAGSKRMIIVVSR